MTALAPRNVTPLSAADFTAPQLALIRQTDAKDCNDAEFNQFIEVSRALGLSPLRRQISAVVFNKNRPDKRNMAIIVRIDGFRAIAARQGDYRPMATAPRFDISEDAKGPTNPHGIVRCEVECFKRFGDEWFPVVGEAYWDEFAPLENEWADDGTGQRRPTGRQKLTETWTKMGRLMIAKCAESQALRRGWPEHFSGVYADEEMDRAIVIEGTATEIVSQHHETQRQARLGGSEAIMLCINIGEPLERCARGQIADRLFDLVKNATEAEYIQWFRKANSEPLKQFWAWEPGDALEVKRFMDQQIEILSEKSNPAPGAQGGAA